MKAMIAILLLGGFNVFADGAELEITSFGPVGPNNRVAEVCGKVLNSTEKSHIVKLNVDYNSRTPGLYNIIVGPEHKFCALVATFYGRVEATLWESGPSVKMEIKNSGRK